MAKIVSQSEFASHVGCSKANITKIIKNGNPNNRLTLVEKNGKILIDLEESIKTWNTFSSMQTKTQREARKRTINKIEEEDLTSSQTDGDWINALDDNMSQKDIYKMKTIADTATKIMNIEVTRSNYISREDVDRIIPSLLAAFKNRIITIPARSSSIIASKLKDEKNIEIDKGELNLLVKEALEKELIDALNFLQKEVTF